MKLGFKFIPIINRICNDESTLIQALNMKNNVGGNLAKNCK
jgi:hypothetical protein